MNASVRPQSPALSFRDNLTEVTKLIEIHEQLTGNGPGRRYQVDVLNKSAILFLCAAFESFVEDLASKAFDHFIEKSETPSKIPTPIRRSIAELIKKDSHELRIWDMADSGWKNVANQYKSQVLKKYVGPFNTPKHGNISALFKDLIGFDDMDTCFKWKGMQTPNAKAKLNRFVELRGALAHGERPAPTTTKKLVTDYIGFLAPLSVRMSNLTEKYCHSITDHHPWKRARYGTVS